MANKFNDNSNKKNLGWDNISYTTYRTNYSNDEAMEENGGMPPSGGGGENNEREIVIVGNSGIIYTSVDAETFIIENSMGNTSGLSVCYSSEQKLFAIARGYGHGLYSSDAINWKGVNIFHDTSISINKVFYVANNINKFLALGSNGCISISSNFTDWYESKSATTGSYILDGCYAKFLNLILILDGGNEKIITSSNAVDWENKNGNEDYLSITCSEELNLLVIVGRSGLIKTSSDGITWTSRTSGVSTDLTSVIYSTEKHLFVAVGKSGSILTSSDAITWTPRTSGTNYNINDIAYSSKLKKFIAVSYVGEILSSFDAINWTKRYTSDSSLNAITVRN